MNAGDTRGCRCCPEEDSVHTPGMEAVGEGEEFVHSGRLDIATETAQSLKKRLSIVEKFIIGKTFFLLPPDPAPIILKKKKDGVQ